MPNPTRRPLATAGILIALLVGLSGCGQHTSRAIGTGSPAGSTTTVADSSTSLPTTTAPTTTAPTTTNATSTTASTQPTSTTTTTSTTWVNGGPGCDAADTLQRIDGDINTLGHTSADLNLAKATINADLGDLQHIAATAPDDAKTDAQALASSYSQAAATYTALATDAQPAAITSASQGLSAAITSQAATNLSAWYAAHC